MSLLNTSSSKIQEPGSVQQFAAAVVNSINPQGGLQSGLAVEITGRTFSIGRDYADYTSSFWVRLLARMALSLGTAQDSIAPTTTLGSVGLRIVFYDGTDGLLDPQYKNEIADLSKGCGFPPLPTGDAATDDANKKAHMACLAAIAGCYKKIVVFPSGNWNANGIALAGATAGAFTNGALNPGTLTNSAVWLTGSLGFDPWTTFGLQLSAAAEFERYDLTNDNVFAGALRLRGGTNSIRGSLEGSYASDNPSDPMDRKGSLLVGADIKLTTGTWLNLNLGGAYNFTGSPFAVFSLASLKYSFANATIPGQQ